MASSNDNVSMALFCDFENVALGVRDANYDKFDIKPVLERLLLKGSIVVKKAYCDWDRYKAFKAPMHEANFELIEIPHVRQSGKNSADIRMVVDALDLCYTKSHVDTFVIISGDSDFSPLVSKLRENAKKVIGVGVKQSTSDLLVANCDEFIFYDDLVRESRRSAAARRDPREAVPAAPKRSPEEEKSKRDEMDKRRDQAVEIAVGTFEALVSERGDSGKIWASVLKEAIKRRKPDFSESYYGFRTFGNLIEEAKARGLLEFGRDEKSGAYVYRSSNAGLAASDAPVAQDGAAQDGVTAAEVFDLKPESRPERTEARQENKQDGKFEPRRGRGRGGRSQAERYAERQERNAERDQQAAQAQPFEPVADQALAEHIDAGDDEDARADAEAIRIRDNRRQQPEAVQVHGDFDAAQDDAPSEPRRGRGNRNRNQSGRKGGERNNQVAAEPVILQAPIDIAPDDEAATAVTIHAAEPVVDLDAMDEVEAQADAQQSPQTEVPVAKRPRNAKLPARKAKAAAKPKAALNVEPAAAAPAAPQAADQAQPESPAQQALATAGATADATPETHPYGKWKGKPAAQPAVDASVEQSAEPVADTSAKPAGKASGKAGGKADAKPAARAKAKPAAKAKAAPAATAPLFDELVPVAIAPDVAVVVGGSAVADTATDTGADQPAKAKPARKPAPRRPAKPKASGDA